MLRGSVGLDREGLHHLLWRRADSRGLVRVNQTRLAEELRVSRLTAINALNDLINQGRISVIPGTAAKRPVLYQVHDPAGF